VRAARELRLLSCTALHGTCTHLPPLAAPPGRGNLAEFVKKKPEAKAYYQLQAVSLKFNFPEPGFLDGVTSKEKPIVKLTKVGQAAVLGRCTGRLPHAACMQP
jgi:hypothetical protein